MGYGVCGMEFIVPACRQAGILHSACTLYRVPCTILHVPFCISLNPQALSVLLLNNRYAVRIVLCYIQAIIGKALRALIVY